jgi:hypothetical protein
MAMLKRLIDVVTMGSERPLRRLTAYYAVLVVVLGIVLFLYPASNALLMGGEPATSSVAPQLLQDGLNAPAFVQQAFGAGSIGELMITTLLLIVGIVALMLPVTWVYMSARKVPGHDQSIVQTLLILPIVVAGVVLIVQNSLALAFSLAGVVAAVRFRTTLDDTRDVVFIFPRDWSRVRRRCPPARDRHDPPLAFCFVVLLVWRYDFGRSACSRPPPRSGARHSKSWPRRKRQRNGIPDRDVMLALTPKKRKPGPADRPVREGFG